MRVQSPASMPRPFVPSRVAILALALAPAALMTAFMGVMGLLLGAGSLGPAGRLTVIELALLANVAVWFAFSPPFLCGWVQLWDPGTRARTGVLGVVALAGVLWFFNLFVYAFTGSLTAALLR